MTGDDYFWTLVDARYGDAASRYVEREIVRQYDAWLDRIWETVCSICGTKANPPLVETLHSHRGLPSLLKCGSRRWLIWDAGLGTMFSWLSFPLHYPQPPAVVESVVRRLFAVRCVVAGRIQEGADNVLWAERLLRATPIDRFRQDNYDAESRFEDWLITAIQEIFAIGHELAHYLHSVDPRAFDNLGERILALLSRAALADENESLRIEREGLSYDERVQRGRDEYVWFRRGWGASKAPQSQRLSLNSRARQALISLAASSALMDEVVCDFISVSCVTRFAQTRQHGWTGIMGAACSSLALNNLSLILWLDRCIVAGSWLEYLPGHERERHECLELLSVLGLSSFLRDVDTEFVPDAYDFEDAVRLSSGLFHARIGSLVQDIDLFPQSVDGGQEMRAQEVLARATFFHLRS